MKTFFILFKNFICILGIFILQLSCSIGTKSGPNNPHIHSPLLTGLDVLVQDSFIQLKGKRVGLITNQTGVDQNMIQNIDLFLKNDYISLNAIFTPEHGLFGSISAGEKILTKNDSMLGIPIFSLYGKTKKPKDEMLKDLDILVFDIQDIGIRSYTYISTMGLAMEAAADNDLEFMVLDRPNPLGLDRVEGNILDLEFSSFIGKYQIPYVYGLTCGELAILINESGWLKSDKCKLTVVKMENSRRSNNYITHKWVPTSPHVPDPTTPHYMVATGILGELGIFSNGVGYTTPFRSIAAPWINADLLASEMNKLNLPGIIFRPTRYTPYYSVYKGIPVEGVQIYLEENINQDLMPIQYYFMQVHKNLYPEKDPFKMASLNRIKMFDKAMGTDKVRKTFSKNFKVEDVFHLLNEGLIDFRIQAEKYYLYDQ